MGMPWVKLWTDFLDDPKLGFVSDAAQLLFVKLMLLAGDCDAEGYLVNGDEPLTIEEIGWRLRINPATMQGPLTELTDAGLIKDDDGIILIVNFQKRQGRSQSEKREQWRKRKQRQRDKENVTGESPVTPASVTPLEGEGEETRSERESEGEGEKSVPPPPRFQKDNPPTPACDIITQLSGKKVPGSQQVKVEKAIHSPVDLEFWRRLVDAWIARGYNPLNITGLLDCFEQRKFPGTATGPPGDNGKTPAQLAAEDFLKEEAT